MDVQRLKLVRGLYESRMRADYMFSQKRVPKLEGIDFGVPQLEILLRLNYMPSKSASIKVLTGLLHKTSSAVTQLVEGLEKEGYVRRKHDQYDRRVVNVSLTKSGEEKFAVFYAELIQSLAEITRLLSDEELEQYTVLNDRIADGI
jgi:DNA-binding MarR family transcriptional regulator